MQETEQTPEVVEYDMSHYAILKDAAIKKGWSIHKLADRLDEEEHVHVSAATRDDGFQILSLKGYTNLVHHKILDELTALPLAPNTDPSLQARLDGIIAAAELRGVSAERVKEQWRKVGPDMDMLERIVSKMDVGFGEPAKKQETINATATPAIVIDELASGEYLKKNPIDLLLHEVFATPEYLAISPLSDFELDGLKAKLIAKLSLSLNYFYALFDYVVDALEIESPPDTKPGEIATIARRVAVWQMQREVKKLEASPVVLVTTAGADIEKAEEAEKKPQAEAITSSPTSVATAENGGENAGQVTPGAEEAKTKGRKKAEPKPPKEPKVKAEKPVDENPEGDVIIGRDEKPENMIAHVFKKYDLDLELAGVAQQILEEYSDFFVRAVRLEADPRGISWWYEMPTGAVLDPEVQKRLEGYLRAIADRYADLNKKCFIHVLDYMKLLRRRDFEKKEIEDNAKAVAKEMADKKERLEECYDGSFSAWVKARLNQPWNIDKNGKYKTKNIKTLAGTIQVLQSGGMTSNRAEIDKYLFELRRLAATPTGDDAELLTVQEFDAIQAARDTLDSLPVSFKEVTETVAEYDVESMKALHKAGFKIPGITETEVQPLGKIDIKPAKAEAPAK